MYTTSRKQFSAFGRLSLFIVLTMMGLFSSLPSGAEAPDEEVHQWMRQTRRDAKAAGICEDYITNSPHYGQTTAFDGPEKPGDFTLKPEPGSLEARFPGVVSRIMDVRRRLHKRMDQLPRPDFWSDEMSKEITESVIKEVNEICRDIDDPRICLLQDQFAKYIRLQMNKSIREMSVRAQIIRVSAGLWELAMACFFEGEEIHLNQMASDLYPDQFAQLQMNFRQRHQLDREIDIAIRKKDGSWRWIEVKDWKPGLSADPLFADKAINQSLAQNQARKKLNLNVEMVLLMKHGMSGIVFLHYRLASKFDQIIFAFPAGN